MEYYSAIKKNTFESVLMRWMKLEPIIQSEVSQKEKWNWRKQPRCPSADEWIRKLWYIYTMEYYSAIKKNTFESVLMKWMKLETIIQSKVSQNENTNTVY